MKSVPADRHEPRNVARDTTRPLHVVARTARPRPKWALLYVALAGIGGAAAAAHVVATGTVLVEVVDAGFGLALFGLLAGWVHINRVALTRSDEPEAGAGPPQVRIVRSRARGQGEL